MPLKRHKALVTLSREHHHALLLCWKINKGLEKGIEVTRIYEYTSWFYSNHLKNHFAIEETELFPILGLNNENVLKALKQHRHLEYIFESNILSIENLKEIAQVLENHVRFEERQLFEEIQKAATNTQLDEILKNSKEIKFIDNNKDEFWA
ncbi:MAG: hemerythrin domain-containing protein [Bacteroidia bacterium]|nr:hemerythrin domain-containing protein [Bacteroidia bacterium]